MNPVLFGAKYKVTLRYADGTSVSGSRERQEAMHQLRYAAEAQDKTAVFFPENADGTFTYLQDDFSKTDGKKAGKLVYEPDMNTGLCWTGEDEQGQDASQYLKAKFETSDDINFNTSQRKDRLDTYLKPIQQDMAKGAKPVTVVVNPDLSIKQGV